MINIEVETYLKNREKLKNNNVYKEEFEHDNCGAGFICNDHDASD